MGRKTPNKQTKLTNYPKLTNILKEYWTFLIFENKITKSYFKQPKEAIVDILHVTDHLMEIYFKKIEWLNELRKLMIISERL